MNSTLNLLRRCRIMPMVSFAIAVQTAIKMPGEAETVPSAYAEYTRLAAFWDRLGWTRRDIDEMPRKMVHDFMIIMKLVSSHEKAMMDSRNNTTGT